MANFIFSPGQLCNATKYTRTIAGRNGRSVAIFVLSFAFSNGNGKLVEQFNFKWIDDRAREKKPSQKQRKIDAIEYAAKRIKLRKMQQQKQPKILS